ncbi:MAG: DUF6978 family protein [Campylobacterota bacterium]
MSLSNEKAKILFDLEKETEEKKYTLPNPNEALVIDLNAKDERFKDELFCLDMHRKYMSLKKRTFQKRVQKTIVLRRLDFFGSHQNPPLTAIPIEIDENLLNLMQKYENKRFNKESHIHFYVEGYDVKWAFPVEEMGLNTSDELYKQAQMFCRYCNIVKLPTFGMKDLLCMT